MAITTTLINERIEAIFPEEVSKRRLQDADGNLTPHFGLRYCGEYLPYACSKDYTPHTRDDVCALAEAASEAFDENCHVSGCFDNGHFLTISPSKETRRNIFDSGSDTIWPRLIIRAGLDGTAFVGSLGWYRDACRNLSMLRKRGGYSARIIHRQSLRTKMEDLVEKFRTCAKGWDATVAMIQRAEEQKVALDSFLDRVYGNPGELSGRGLTIHRNRTREIISRVISERRATGRPRIETSGERAYEVSLWEAYNAVQGYTQHCKSRHGSPTSVERAAKALSDKAVLTAEELVFGNVA